MRGSFFVLAMLANVESYSEEKMNVDAGAGVPAREDSAESGLHHKTRVVGDARARSNDAQRKHRAWRQRSGQPSGAENTSAAVGSRHSKRSVVIPGFLEASRPKHGRHIGVHAAAVALVCRFQTPFETKAWIDLVTPRNFRGGSKAAIGLIVCQDVETEIDALAHAPAPPRKPVRATAVIARRRHQFAVRPDSESQLCVSSRCGSRTAKGGERRR